MNVRWSRPLCHRTVAGTTLSLLTAAVVTLGAVPAALAQPPTPPARDGVRLDAAGHPYRAWDVAFGAGLHVDRDVPRATAAVDLDPDIQIHSDNWGGGAGLHADVGRYWSSHLKTELGVAWQTGREVYGTQIVQVPGGAAQATTATEARRAMVSGAVTWQFLVNTFAHPYVSAGVRVNLYDLHTTRVPVAWIPGRVPGSSVTVPGLDVRSRQAQVLPFVAAGYKSYLSERTFVRSEIATGVAADGISHWTVRAGIGVDF